MTHDNMWWFISWSTKRRGECPIELTGPVSETHALANHGATVWLALSHWSEAALVKRKPRVLH